MKFYRNFHGVKVKSTPVSILGTANQAPIQVIVTGPAYDTVMNFADTVDGRSEEGRRNARRQIIG